MRYVTCAAALSELSGPCRFASSWKLTPNTTSTAHAHRSSGDMKRRITAVLGSSFLPLTCRRGE